MVKKKKIVSEEKLRSIKNSPRWSVYCEFNNFYYILTPPVSLSNLSLPQCCRTKTLKTVPEVSVPSWPTSPSADD